MFIGLLNVCTIESFVAPLALNYKGPRKCVSLNNQQCQVRPMLVDIP